MLEIANNEFWRHPVTSGMYRIDEFVAGSYYTMVPNEYNDTVQPKIGKIIVNFVADNITAAQAGLVDLINTNNQTEISEFNKLSGMTMFPVEIMFYRYFICNIEGVDGNTNPAMADICVREAILHAIDRETLAESLFPGLAHISNGGVSPDNPAYIGTEYAYDPELAHRLFEEAGWDFNNTLRLLLYYSDQTSLDFMDAIVYYLGEAGVKAEYTVTSQGTQDLYQTRNYDIGYKGLSAFDVSEWYGEYNSTNSNFRMIFNGDTAFDEYIEQYVSSTSQEEKNAALVELQKMEKEKLYKLPLYTIGNNVFVNTDHVQLPEGMSFGNPWYRTNMHFEDWELK